MANEPKDHTRVADLLSAYGSDVARWPTEARELVERLTADERAKLFRDEQAFDSLLRQTRDAGDGAPAPDALMARIVATANVKSDATDAGEARDIKVVTFEPLATRPTSRVSPQREWAAAAALLAASLILGLFIGSSTQFQPTARTIGDYAGIGPVASTAQISALDEALQNQDDEDIL